MLVVPNGFHRLDAKVMKDRYPALRVFCPAGGRKKVEQVVKVDGTYADAPKDDDVSAADLGGTAVDIAALTPDDVALLTGFLKTADKGAAHLTLPMPHHVDQTHIAIVRICEGFLYADVIADRRPDIGRAVRVIEALLSGLDLAHR